MGLCTLSRPSLQLITLESVQLYTTIWFLYSVSRYGPPPSDFLSSCAFNTRFLPTPFWLLSGRPRPRVTWFLENTIIDDSYTHEANDVTINRLSYPNIGRQHLHARLICQASNTNLTHAQSEVVILDVNREYSLLLLLLLLLIAHLNFSVLLNTLISKE
jgi:hypothetical protein